MSGTPSRIACIAIMFLETKSRSSGDTLGSLSKASGLAGVGLAFIDAPTSSVLLNKSAVALWALTLGWVTLPIARLRPSQTLPFILNLLASFSGSGICIRNLWNMGLFRASDINSLTDVSPYICHLPPAPSTAFLSTNLRAASSSSVQSFLACFALLVSNPLFPSVLSASKKTDSDIWCVISCPIISAKACFWISKDIVVSVSPSTLSV